MEFEDILLVFILFAVLLSAFKINYAYIDSEQLENTTLTVKGINDPAIITENKYQYKTNLGDHYFIKTYIEDEESEGNINYFAFTTPNESALIYAKASLTPDVDFTVTIYENATITGGSNMTGINNNRNSNNVSKLIPVSSPTVIDSGTVIWTARNGGGKNPLGVNQNLNYDIIAKYNTTYLFEIVKNVAQSGVMDVDFWWYEE